MANPSVLFDQVDVNHDGYISQNEFREFVRRNSTYPGDTANSATIGSVNNLSTTGNYASLGAYETVGTGNVSTRDVTYTTDAGFTGDAYGASIMSTGGVYGTSAVSTADVSGAAVAASDASAATVNYGSGSEALNIQHYETDEQGNFKDSNPQIIRRAAADGPLTYTQNVQVRFLQPPPVPPPGPLIIKEVRPPQPPAPAPLRLRQQAPPLPTPPPLVLRERPPQAPASVPSQTVIRNLAPIPIPPRSVIIERLPPAPPKPRDIIIERWIPYGPMAKRRTIVQRAEAAKAYPEPHNIIIQYDAPQVRVVRQFQRLGVAPENPELYIQRYGATLFDSQTLLQQARAAGVLEDISPPAAFNSYVGSTSEQVSSSNAGFVGFNETIVGNNQAAKVSGGNDATFYESSSYSGGDDISRVRSSIVGTGGTSYRVSTAARPTRDINGIFATADINKDGVLSPAEFQNFVRQ